MKGVGSKRKPHKFESEWWKLHYLLKLSAKKNPLATSFSYLCRNHQLQKYLKMYCSFFCPSSWVNFQPDLLLCLQTCLKECQHSQLIDQIGNAKHNKINTKAVNIFFKAEAERNERLKLDEQHCKLNIFAPLKTAPPPTTRCISKRGLIKYNKAPVLRINTLSCNSVLKIINMIFNWNYKHFHFLLQLFYTNWFA